MSWGEKVGDYRSSADAVEVLERELVEALEAHPALGGGIGVEGLGSQVGERLALAQGGHGQLVAPGQTAGRPQEDVLADLGIEAARSGDARAADAVGEVADWCGVGIRAIVNLFNPEIIVLGGGLAQVWRAAEDRVNDAMSRSTMMSPREDVIIRAALLGDDASLIGAAELAFAPVLDHPQAVLQAG